MIICFSYKPVFANDINIKVNGEIIVFKDQKPYIDNNNRTMVPIRMIEKLGGKIDWDSESQSITVNKESTNIVLTNIVLIVGEKVAKINDDNFIMDTELF